MSLGLKGACNFQESKASNGEFLNPPTKPAPPFMRVFAISDIHVDFKKNADFLKRIVSHGQLHGEYIEDALIVAGDVSHEIKHISWALGEFASVFKYVFYCVGNHELWVTTEEKKKNLNSMHKFEAVMKAAEKVGAITSRKDIVTKHNNNVSIIPLQSWYDGSLFFDAGPEHSSSSNEETNAEREKGAEELAKKLYLDRVTNHFLKMNERCIEPRTGGGGGGGVGGDDHESAHSSITKVATSTSPSSTKAQLKDAKRGETVEEEVGRVGGNDGGKPGGSRSKAGVAHTTAKHRDELDIAELKKYAATEKQPLGDESFKDDRSDNEQTKGTIITFSHFLPRKVVILLTAARFSSNKESDEEGELILNFEIAKLVRRNTTWNFSRIAGCSRLDEQLRRANHRQKPVRSQIHVYGHSHRNVNKCIEGVSYVGAMMGYPRERQNGTCSCSGLKLIWDEEANLR
eukprot:jgi/Bigna1/77664/fgenesh1_pg.49_\